MGALQELIRNITASADALWSSSALRCEPGELACRPGCIGCCTGLFAIGTAEALLVRSAAEALPLREREPVRAAAEAIRRATAAIFPGDVESGILDPGRAAEVSRFVERTHAIPCPFLAIDGRCRVYANRPLTCRTFGLALVEGARTESPACALNFGASSPARVVETGIPLESLRHCERQLDTAVVSAGWDPSAETTIPHAIVGAAFEASGSSR